MAISLFSWRALTEAVNKIVSPQRFIRDTIYKTVKTHLASTLDIEIIVGNKKLAPFVSPIEGGVVVEKLGRHVDTVKFPRIRMKKPLNAQELLTEKNLTDSVYVGGTNDINSYRQQKIGEELLDLKTQADRRLEWMACRSLYGGYEVSQENVAFKLDFQMPSAHKITLTGDALWNSAKSNPEDSIIKWKRLIQNATGLNADILILGSEAADAFRNNPTVLKKLDNKNYNVGALAITNSSYIGRFAGVAVYEYNEQYTDAAGLAQNMIDPKSAILIASSARFELHYGVIIDLKCGQIAMPFFSKQYEEEDPSALWLLVETDPLPVPHQPEAIVAATVVGDVPTEDWVA